MKRQSIFSAVAFAVFIGVGIFLTTGFAQESHKYYPDPSTCVCSAPVELARSVNTGSRFASSLRSELEPSYLMSLYNCQCGPLSCAVSAQAISCRK